MNLQPTGFKGAIRVLRIKRDLELLKSLFDKEEAAQLVRDKRGDIGMRECAADIGISPATLSRIEHGHDFDVQTMKRIFEWLVK